MIKYEIGYPINWRTQDYGTIEDYEKKTSATSSTTTYLLPHSKTL